MVLMVLLMAVPLVPLVMTVEVMPEASSRFVTLVWRRVGSRSIEIAVVDCPQAPELIALATERAISGLPGGLEALAGPTASVAVGGVAGVGAPVLSSAAAPRAGRWVTVERGHRWRLGTGLKAEVGSHRHFSGAAMTGQGDLMLGVSRVTDAAHVGVYGTLGFIVGSLSEHGRWDLVAPRVGLRPYLHGRAGWLRAGVALELVPVWAAWHVDGPALPAEAEPPLRIAFEVAVDPRDR